MCNHSPEIMDGILKCRICGEVVNEHEEVLLPHLQSKSRARDTQDMMVSTGDWIVAGKDENGAIYRRWHGQVEELLRLRKRGDRDWVIVRVLRNREE